MAGSGVILIGLCLGLLIVHFQQSIADLARTTRDEVLPVVLVHQRTAINVERLARFGETVYSSADPAARRTARIAARILAQDAAFEKSTKTLEGIERVFENISSVERFREEQDRLRRTITERLGTLTRLIESLETRHEVVLDGRAAIARHSVLRDLYRLRLLLGRVDALRDPVELRTDREFFKVVARDVVTALDAGVLRPLERSGGPAPGDVRAAVQEAAGAYALQGSILGMDTEAASLWDEAKHYLGELSSGLTSDAASIAADRFTEIHEFALRAMWLSAGSVAVIVILVVVLAALARRHVVEPIMAATRGLDRVQRERRAVLLPANRLREMDAIRLAVERLGMVLNRTALYARDLEEANRALEVEVAERVRAQAELAQAKEAAESAAMAKSKFLASMSHEIRTPMNAILGMADMLSETRLTTEQQRYVDVFRTSGEMLMELLNDILDLTKVEAGKVELERIEFSLAEILDGAWEMAAYAAREKGLALERDVAPDAPGRLVGDPVRLKQILGNLLGNAVKFTEAGFVRLRVRREPGLGENGLRFTCTDSGVGIPADMQARIFDSFTQADSTTTRRYGGTGLGLSITRHLVELMGGSVWVESEPGRGSTFTVVLPFAAPGSCGAAAEHASAVPPAVRVLVLLADPTERTVVAENLLLMGARVEDVDDFDEARLFLAEAADAGDPFAAVLLDSALPGLPADVPPAMAAVRGVAPLPAVLLLVPSPSDTTPGPPAARRGAARTAGLGAARVLDRPVGRRALEEALAHVFRDAPPPSGILPVPRGAEGALRVLLVEDIRSNRALVDLYLRGSGCELTMAENGLQGLEIFKRRGADVVLMDMQMPVMDGFTATAAIRAWEREKGRDPVPIVALTAHAYKDDVDRCLRAGCSGYLAKPVKKADLLGVLFEHAALA
ncbi:MAG: response regulator [Desulfovibrionaceae bacterium]|nr:response regulator [Desulfovibrionaceae bacterium]